MWEPKQTFGYLNESIRLSSNNFERKEKKHMLTAYIYIVQETEKRMTRCMDIAFKCIAFENKYIVSHQL